MCAKMMSYTAADGITSVTSYWVVAQTNFDWINNICQITFNGYKDSAAKDAKKEVIGQKIYTISGTDFITFFAAAALDGVGKNPLANSYNMVSAFRDTGAVLDSTGKVVTPAVSFFSGAVDV